MTAPDPQFSVPSIEWVSDSVARYRRDVDVRIEKSPFHAVGVVLLAWVNVLLVVAFIALAIVVRRGF